MCKRSVGIQAAIKGIGNSGEPGYLTAEASFERTEKLYVKKLIAQEVYEGEKSNLAVLLSEYESVESELDMLKGQYNQKGISNIITATDAGTILELPIKEGGSVMARGTLNEGTTVARVADLQSLVFKGNVLESDILKLAVGMELSLSVLMDKNITIDGALSLVAPKGIVQDGVARFEITAGLFIPEEYKQMIKAGCTANAQKNSGGAEKARWLLEEKYFQFNYGSVFVEIVADKSKYEKRFLKAGILGWNIY
ncbi:MAG: efflux RND transporter periplasmic adaptor subunit [Phocaeicola vulgatus]